MKKILKKILVVTVSLVAVLLVAAIFVKKEYAIERTITIRRSNADVFNYVKQMRNQDHYNKWVMVDPAMKKDFRGTDGTVGFVYAWDGNKDAGKGEQEIKELNDGKSINTELRFEKPMKSIAYAHMITERLSNEETKLVWGMTGRTPYPMNLANVFLDGLLGKDIETSLNNLKEILEKDKGTLANTETN